MKATNFTKTLLPMYHTTWNNIPEDYNHNSYNCENLTFHPVIFYGQAKVKQISVPPNEVTEATKLPDLFSSLFLL
jgi:hypothetical protein